MRHLQQISTFKNKVSSEPKGHEPIMLFTEAVMNGKYKALAEKIRSATGKEKDILKGQLPAVTISGTFYPTRASAKLVQHSGFVCIDIDYKPDGVTWEDLRDTCGSWENVFFSALSVSGNGLFLIIPILKPENHLQHYEALRIEFDNMGIKIDDCQDIARLRFVSYDPAAIYNPDAKPYRNIYQPKPLPVKFDYNRDIEIDKLRDWVERKGYSFIKGSRHPYIKQLVGACHRLGKSQSETERYCLQYQQSDFNAKEILKIIKDMYKNSAWCEDGIKHGKPKPVNN